MAEAGGANEYNYFAFDFTAAAESQTMTLLNDDDGDHTVVADFFLEPIFTLR